MAVPSIELQKRLKELGFDPGPLDNLYSDRTEAAVKDYQRAHGLKPDGDAGPVTEASLFPELYADAGAAASAAPKEIDEAEIRLMIKRSKRRMALADLAAAFGVEEDGMRKLLRAYMIDQVEGLV